MCFSAIEGIEVQERHRRYPNEARRKRLNFVRDRNSFKGSDEWSLVRPRTSERLPRQEIQDQQQYWPPPPSHGAYPPPHPPFPTVHPPHFPPTLPQPMQPMQPPGFRGQGHEGFPSHQRNDFGNGIEHVEEFRPAHQNCHQEITPRYVEVQPRHGEVEPRAHMPSNLQVNIGRSRSSRGQSRRRQSRRRGRSRTRSRSRGPRGGYRHHSNYSDETSVDSSTGSYGSERRYSRGPRNFHAESYDSFDEPQNYQRYSHSRPRWRH